MAAVAVGRAEAGDAGGRRRPDSELRRRLADGLRNAGRRLATDAELQAKVDDWVERAVAYVVENYKGEVADLIATTVERWDGADTSRRIELQVGRDLQFIRINGTVVGGLAGLPHPRRRRGRSVLGCARGPTVAAPAAAAAARGVRSPHCGLRTG